MVLFVRILQMRISAQMSL